MDACGYLYTHRSMHHSVQTKDRTPMAISDIPMWVPLLFLFPLLLLLKNRTGARRQNKCLPPSPPKLPIIGHLHQFGAMPHQFLWQLSKKYGPVMLLHLGGKPLIVISSAKAAEEVLKVHDLKCCNRPTSASSKRLTYNYLDIVFSPYGEYWRDIRKICVLELLSVRRVQSYQILREEEVSLLVYSISQSSSCATPVDLSEKLTTLTASILFKTAFGQSFRGSDLNNEKFGELMHEAEVMLAGLDASELFPFMGWIMDKISGRLRRLESISNELDRFLQQVIDLHLDPERTKQEHEDIVDVLLRIEREQTKSGDTGWFTKDHIKAILFDVFLGGVNTVAVTAVWAMAELARNPRVMKTAQDEVRSFVGNKGKVTASDTEQLHYLKMVIKETLRLHPPAALLIPRVAMSHFKVSGYDIYPKTLLQVNSWAIARDPEYWKNPEEFSPERFIDGSSDYKEQHFEMLPFGAGRRSCPGVYMGTTTIELALANLLYCFDWKLPPGMKEEDINMEESPGVSLTKKKTALNLVPVQLF